MIALSFVFGVISFSLIPILPSTGLVNSLIFMVVLIATSLVLNGQRSIHFVAHSRLDYHSLIKSHYPITMALLASSVGYLYAGFITQYWLDYQLPGGKSIETVIQGRIDSMPQHFDGLTRIEIRLDKPLPGSRAASLSWLPYSKFGTIKLNCYDCTQQFNRGERWRLKVRLRGIHGLMNPGGFDYERWAFQRRLVASGSIRKDNENQLLSASAQGLLSAGIKTAYADFTRHVLAGSRATGIIQAITLGDRSAIDEYQWQIFRRTGTGHLIAVSGLHIALVFGLAFALLKFVFRLFPRMLLYVAAQRLAAIMALPFTLYYAWFAGFSLPTQRALLMLTVLYIAFLTGRRVLGWYTFLVALCAVLIVDPLASLSQGFWLSFSAVAAIIGYAHWCRSRAIQSVPEERMQSHLPARLRQWITGWILVQLAVSAAVLPLSAVFFGELSWISPLVNLFAIPYFGLTVVPCALLSLCLWLSGWIDAAAMFLQLSASALSPMQSLLDSISSWSASSISVNIDTLIRLALMLAVVLGALPRIRRQYPLAVVALSLLMATAPVTLHNGEFELRVLDVGQGLSNVIKTRNHTLLFDVGVRFTSGYDMGRIVVIPYLKYARVDTLDKLIISHGDRDHAGGISTVLDRYTPLVILSSERFNDRPILPCRQGFGWHWDGVLFEILSPIDEFGPRHNDRSCVLRVTSPYGRVLLTGDIGKPAETALVERYGLTLASDVLVVAHHGSKTSSSDRFLQHVDPEIAIISRGLYNNFGHPHPDVVNRLKRHDVLLYDTAVNGSVVVEFSTGGPHIGSYRQSYWQVWHTPWRSQPVNEDG